MLVLPVFVVALRIFGGPSHQTRRVSATNFWALDMSGGAGSLSSPVLQEHPKNVSECAMMSERFFRGFFGEAPQWLVWSAATIATRELATRRVQKELLPALISDEDARPKALALAKKLRSNFDNRVEEVLQPAGYGNAERIINRYIDSEAKALQRETSKIKSIDDALNNDMTKAILEVRMATASTGRARVSRAASRVHIARAVPAA